MIFDHDNLQGVIEQLKLARRAKKRLLDKLAHLQRADRLLEYAIVKATKEAKHLMLLDERQQLLAEVEEAAEGRTPDDAAVHVQPKGTPK